MKEKIQDAVFIKETAIHGEFVWVIKEDNTVTLRGVVLGDSKMDDEWVEIKSGVNPGEKVITNPPSSLEEGSRVKIGGYDD